VRRRVVLATVAAVVVVAAGAGAYGWHRAGESDAVAPSAAVAAFRADPGPQADDAPPPGVYTYAVSGWECGGVGPVCLRRELPATGQLTLRRTGGGLVEQLFLSEQHGEGRTLVRGEGGWRLAEQWSDLTFLGLGRETRDAADPQPLVLPDDLGQGRAWSEAYRLRSVPVEVEARVLRRESVDVAGQPVEAVVIEAATTMGGALAGTIRETTWYAPSLGLDLRRVVSRRIDGSFRYELELDARLTDVIPAR
jgi:hypothetical protein